MSPGGLDVVFGRRGVCPRRILGWRGGRRGVKVWRMCGRGRKGKWGQWRPPCWTGFEGMCWSIASHIEDDGDGIMFSGISPCCCLIDLVLREDFLKLFINP